MPQRLPLLPVVLSGWLLGMVMIPSAVGAGPSGRRRLGRYHRPRRGPVNDPLYVKALVLKDDATTAVLITVDAVAIGEIGRIGNDFLAKVRGAVGDRNPGFRRRTCVINASHCHGIVRGDTDAADGAGGEGGLRRTWCRCKVGAGAGHEDRISENRRLKLKDGSEVDMRRAYSLPRDEEVAGVGPIDPQIGLLRLDREDGRPLAVALQLRLPSDHESAEQGQHGRLSRLRFEGDRGEPRRRRHGLLRAGLRRRHQSRALQGGEPPPTPSRWGTCSATPIRS